MTDMSGSAQQSADGLGRVGVAANTPRFASVSTAHPIKQMPQGGFWWCCQPSHSTVCTDVAHDLYDEQYTRGPMTYTSVPAEEGLPHVILKAGLMDGDNSDTAEWSGVCDYPYATRAALDHPKAMTVTPRSRVTTCRGDLK